MLKCSASQWGAPLQYLWKLSLNIYFICVDCTCSMVCECGYHWLISILWTNKYTCNLNLKGGWHFRSSVQTWYKIRSGKATHLWLWFGNHTGRSCRHYHRRRTTLWSLCWLGRKPVGCGSLQHQALCRCCLLQSAQSRLQWPCWLLHWGR